MTPSQKHHAMTSMKADFLEMLLNGGMGNVDSVPIPDRCDNGRNEWRGHAIQELKSDDLIVKVGTSASTQRRRHGGSVGRWRILNEDAARTYLKTLRDWLIVNRWPEDPPTPPAGSPAAVGKTIADHVELLRTDLTSLRADADHLDAANYIQARDLIVKSITLLADLASDLQKTEGGAA